MLDRRALWSLPLIAAGALLTTYLLAPGPEPEAEPTSPTPVSDPVPDLRAPEPPRAATDDATRWIVAGGGATPEYNQVQLEQDLTLAAEVLGESGPGVLLYAGGPESAAVQVLREEGAPEGLRHRLAMLFNPREGRDSRYRATTLEPLGAASRDGILEALRGALGAADLPPITVYLAGHGLGGEDPVDSRLLTWGVGDLWVEDLASVLDETDHRPVRFVVTSCYGGGFAELAFHQADPEQGEAQTKRCGFFATTWDRAAAGCDPNPDRGAQEGYGIHFLHALRGERRDGSEARATIDLDGDGAISLLEAHDFARITSRSLDVPVTTSERFLRAAALEEEAPAGAPAPALPEERAVIAQLGEALELDTEEDAAEALEQLDASLRESGGELDALDGQIGDATEALAAALLHRWPVLDDPWHPDFEATLADADAIEAFLDESALSAELAELERRQVEVADGHDTVLVRMSRVERLMRAYETVRLARRLSAEGGRYWLSYQALLACERGRP